MSFICCTEITLEQLRKEKEDSVKAAEVFREELESVKKQYEQVKSMLVVLGLDPKQFSKSRRENNPTSKVMINDYNSSTRYNRRKETQKALQYIFMGGQLAHIMGPGIMLQPMHPKK